MSFAGKAVGVKIASQGAPAEEVKKFLTHSAHHCFWKIHPAAPAHLEDAIFFSSFAARVKIKFRYVFCLLFFPTYISAVFFLAICLKHSPNDSCSIKADAAEVVRQVISTFFCKLNG
ncbi:uncharacterized protein LOC131315810 [Rhododendron vialii]|uniref:uncharacterized protein LOC131315810 n=1 Tax=Rhododendron vialii TaxID=182163 RepID=UPI00265E1A1F|nr:uncharacterized protein LOC131315810 [Rhododendron vialii]